MLKPPTLERLLAPTARTGRRAIALDLALLSLLVIGIYFLRLTELPVMGEEGRRARGAVNMIETGDWVVLKQQGLVFPDRPPMTNWLIAAGTLLRGSADVVAIRLPSVVAVLLTTLLVYWVCVEVDSRLTAIAAAGAFATFAQVMQLGRLGESEAVFTCFVAGSLLVWHLAYSRGRPPVQAWVPGYALAALGALVKGLQAPVYFVAITFVFLVLRRQWRWLVGWGQWLGLATFVAIVGAWQIPYYLATDRQSVVETWFGVIGPRLGFSGLIGNLATYPFETIGCLAAWSLLGIALLDRELRTHLVDNHPQFVFIVTALAVSYPTVWFSAGAKGRYYMPLYPIAAVLVGMIIDGLSNAGRGSLAYRVRRAMTWATGGLAVVLAAGLVAGSLFDLAPALRQPLGWTLASAILAIVAVLVTRRALAHHDDQSFRHLVFTLAAVFGMLHTSVWLAGFRAIRIDVAPDVHALRAEIPTPDRLISFGPIDSRFLYHYELFVPELPWPNSLEEVPADVSFFAFDVRPEDTPDARYNWRGMKWWLTSGRLPFEWEEIGRVAFSGKASQSRNVEVVVGRAGCDATRRLIPTDDGVPRQDGSDRAAPGDAGSSPARPD